METADQKRGVSPSFAITRKSVRYTSGGQVVRSQTALDWWRAIPVFPLIWD